LRDGLENISFDSVGLQIESVHINKGAAKFATTESKLAVTLPKGAKAGAKFDVEIKYRARRARASILFCPTRTIPTGRWRSGPRENRRTRATTCRPMTTRTIA